VVLGVRLLASRIFGQAVERREYGARRSATQVRPKRAKVPSPRSLSAWHRVFESYPMRTRGQAAPFRLGQSQASDLLGRTVAGAFLIDYEHRRW